MTKKEYKILIRFLAHRLIVSYASREHGTFEYEEGVETLRGSIASLREDNLRRSEDENMHLSIREMSKYALGRLDYLSKVVNDLEAEEYIILDQEIGGRNEL